MQSSARKSAGKFFDSPETDTRMLKAEKRKIVRSPFYWNGIQAYPIELSKGLEYCAAAEALMAAVVAAVVEIISRHFCSQ